MKALIADDDPVNRDILIRMLARIGWEAEAVGDGRAAIERAGKSNFDAILLDLFMPGLDGFGTARLMRESGSRAVLIAVSGSDDDEKALGSGFDRCLWKPYTLDDLRDALKGIGA